MEANFEKTGGTMITDSVDGQAVFQAVSNSGGEVIHSNIGNINNDENAPSQRNEVKEVPLNEGRAEWSPDSEEDDNCSNAEVKVGPFSYL